ncbi:MAG: DivIVA domain-containing protein [Coriobacteriia bacterium]|nr:DivIVA domain-containing protein [Coriobacteriia bacterium]
MPDNDKMASNTGSLNESEKNTMKITALDIHQKEFARGMRGYREAEVDSYLDQLAVEVDGAEKRIKELEEQAAMLESRDASLAAERNTINNTLLTAQRAADTMLKKAQTECADTLEAAQRQAEAQLESARQQADRIVEDARQKRHQVIGSFARLQGEQEKFRNGYLAQLESFLAAVRKLEADSRASVEEIVVPQDLKEELSMAQQAAVETDIRESAPASSETVAPPVPPAQQPAAPAPAPEPVQPAPTPRAAKAVPASADEDKGPLAAALEESDFFEEEKKPSPKGADESTLSQAPVKSAPAPAPAPAPAAPAAKPASKAAKAKAPAPAPAKAAEAKAPEAPSVDQWGDMDDNDLDIEEID